MNRQTAESTRPDTLCPATTLLRSRTQHASGAIAHPLFPRQRRVAEHHEVAVEHRVALVVAQRPAARIEHDAAGGLDDRLPRRGVPFAGRAEARVAVHAARSEEHTSELQSLMRTSDPVFCLKK